MRGLGGSTAQRRDAAHVRIIFEHPLRRLAKPRRAPATPLSFPPHAALLSRYHAFSLGVRSMKNNELTRRAMRKSLAAKAQHVRKKKKETSGREKQSPAINKNLPRNLPSAVASLQKRWRRRRQRRHRHHPQRQPASQSASVRCRSRDNNEHKLSEKLPGC